jgi:integrase
MNKSIIIQKFSDILIRRTQSEATINTYLNVAEKFIYDNHPDSIDKLTFDYIDKYLLDILNKKSPSSYNQYLSVLKILYRDVFKQKYKLFKLKPIKVTRKVKNLHSVDYVLDILSSITNLKHKTIILVLLSTGIRISELLSVTVKDLDSNNNRILIRNGKGGRARFVPMNDELLDSLRKYYRVYRPIKYLFEGQNEKYSKSSVNKMIKKYFGNEYHAHLFRHTYITFMIEQDVNVKRIKLITGQKDDRSVEWYYQYTNKSLEIKINPIRELV